MTTQALRPKGVRELLLPAALLMGALGAIAVQVVPLPLLTGSPALAGPETVTIQPGELTYRAPGQYFQNNAAIDGPQITVSIAAPLEIMKFQVTAADYQACVADGACDPALGRPGKGNVPVTGVHFGDAQDYARWLSARTGQHWTLPSDAEWAFAAAERYEDETLGQDDGSNPALRWIADYRLETSRNRVADSIAHEQGHFGANSQGLMDLAGNVWEWTDTCHTRVHLGRDGAAMTEQSACTIRVVQGQHRAAMSYFIRDAKSGGCSVGVPPDNLGIRLVRRPAWHEDMLGWLMGPRTGNV